MAETKLPSPLLDGFVLGEPISRRNGVFCCPAVKEGSEQKYIVKIISLPASQAQLDALLLTRAYRDPAEALDYFRQQAEDLGKEVSVLRSMSDQGGFVCYLDGQVTPMKTNRLGYYVYLLNEYRESLTRFSKKHHVTHLEAVNLGLDICNALEVCRKAGYLYADLKPNNIYCCSQREFRIGDLGFIPLDYLRFTSMPEKYCSRYTAPELRDYMNTVNETADVYSLGMILYELFNGGVLPQADSLSQLEAPAYADEDMTGILLKACAAHPENRWQSPSEMGQALADYLQSHTVNNDPIYEEPDAKDEKASEEVSQVNDSNLSDTRVISSIQDMVHSTQSESADSTSSEFEKTQVVSLHSPEAQEDAAAEMAFEGIAAAAAENETMLEVVESIVPDVPDAVSAAPSVPSTAADSHAEPAAPEDSELDQELSEVASLLGTAPEPVAKKSAYPEFPSNASKKRKLPPVQKQDYYEKKPKKHPILKLFTFLVILALLAGIGYGAYWFYQNYYLQDLNGMTLEGSQSNLTVTLDTQIPDRLLRVVCTDVYGTSISSDVISGQAAFQELQPDSLYRVNVEIQGFHELVGNTSAVFTTEALTEIVGVSAVAGSEDGSVVLSLNSHGHEPEKWLVTYSAEDESEKSESFSGHTFNIRGLTVGKSYTFRVDSTEDNVTTGNNTVVFSAINLISARNLEVLSRLEGDITIGWTVPDGVTVDSWTVRCFCGEYDVTQTVSGNIATFSGTELDKSYTVEVTAEGMMQPTSLTISENPVIISRVNTESKDDYALAVSWEFDGETPSGGWLLTYTTDKRQNPISVKCSKAKTTISPVTPGAAYYISIQATDDTSVFGGTAVFEAPAAEMFVTQGLSANKITASLLTTPADPEWLASNVKDDFKTTFTPGEKMSVVLSSNAKFYVEHENLKALFSFRDQDGNVVSDFSAVTDLDWYDLWFADAYQEAELNIPNIPQETGRYTLEIYFNGKSVAACDFSIS